MASNVDPDRVYFARRTGLMVRLIRVAKLKEQIAQRWAAQWETEAARRGLTRDSAAYWEPAWDWITLRQAD